jgi:hypothetical protein
MMLIRATPPLGIFAFFLLWALRSEDVQRGFASWCKPSYKIDRIEGLVLDPKLLLTALGFFQQAAVSFVMPGIEWHAHWAVDLSALPSLDVFRLLPGVNTGVRMVCSTCTR